MGASTLGIGETQTFFHVLGKEWLEIKQCVKGEAIYSVLNLRYFAGIWSAPVEQSNLMKVNDFNTSL